jgi:hypothetical protein
MDDLEQEILAQEIASRKKTKKVKVPKEKVKKEKVFKLKKDHVTCGKCMGKGFLLEFISHPMDTDSQLYKADCHYCQGKGQYKPKKEKIVKSESELVHEYANRVIDGKAARGHKDERFAYTQKETQTNKQLWLDQDFQCHLVFQSKAQKYEFMAFLEEKFGFEFDEMEGHQIQIANGLRLARLMGCDLKPEKSAPYPLPNLDLMPLVLDYEEVE